MRQKLKPTTPDNLLTRLWSNRFVRYGLLPLLIYFIFFCFFTWPWISNFNHYFFTDSGDGLQNVWNIWWVNKSVAELHQLPWHTQFLHYPFGVTLVGQTLNPFNGFVAIGLLQIFSLTQTFNFLVIFSFLFGGLTAFWLCYYLTKSYWSSVIGGAVFTFSSYHFAHAIGHMQLVSLEFVPLFILLWWKLIKRPSYKLAIGTSFTLLLVLFCDYYYFLYSLMLASFIFGYLLWRKEIPSLKLRSNWLPMLVFVIVTLIIVMPLPIALLLQNNRDMLTGSHPARVFSTDIATPVITGGFWYFHSLTDGYWRHVKGYISETTIYLGISVISVLAIAVWKRTKIHRDVVFWLATGVFFGVMSFGPRLMVAGRSLEKVPMPYVIMERIVPGMKLSGMPVRMMFVVTLASAIIVAMVLSKVNLNKRSGQLLIVAFCTLFILEMWPTKLPLTPNTQPRYVSVLAGLPSTGGVLDNAATSEPLQLYHQTGFEKPMVFGYVSRTPKSLEKKEFPLFAYTVQNKYELMCHEFKLRYITTPKYRPLKTTFPIVYKDDEAIVYDLKNSPNC